MNIMFDKNLLPKIRMCRVRRKLTQINIEKKILENRGARTMEGQLFFVKVKGDDRYRPFYALDETDAKLDAEFRFEWRMEIDKMLRQIPNVVDLHAMFVKRYTSS